MSIFGKFFSALRAAPQAPGRGLSLISHWLANVSWVIESRFLSLAQRGYAFNEVVYACLRMLAQSVPEPPLRAYQENGDGRQELERDHPLVTLIRRPNELMTEYEFWELTTLYMAIVGRATWWKERANGGQIVALWPLRPDRVGPVYSRSEEEGERVLWGWAYQTPGTGQVTRLPRRDVLAFNFPDPAGESGGIVEGLGPLQVLARQVAADNEATKFVGALLANYASPGIALKMKGAAGRSVADLELLKAHFRAEFGGVNQGTPVILDAETEIQQIGFNLRQLEFPEVRSISESRIAAAFGVPAVLVGLKAGLDASTYNNVAGMRRYFTETTLANYWRRFHDQYQEDVVSEFGDDLVVEFDLSGVQALAARREEQLAPVAEAYRAGALTQNEYRVALGLPRLEGGDVVLLPANMIPMPADVEEAAKVVTLKHNGYQLLEGGKKN